MYKIFGIGLVIMFFLTSCGQSQSSIDEAKEKMLDTSPSENSQLITVDDTELDQDDMVSENITENFQENNSEVKIRIESLDANPPLEFDRIHDDAIGIGEVIISGKILNQGGVDKIEVLFSNNSSNFPDDAYTLQTFNPGDETFRYVASSKNQVLDIGTNEYIFRAFSGATINQTKVIIEVPGEQEEKNLFSELENNIAIEDLDLPTDTSYGEPVFIGDTSISYSQIQGFEISQESVSSISCDGLTEYLKTRISNWFYWNTCRDLVAGKGISYNVIRLDGEKYFYERHYVDYIHGLYGVYELEAGEGVNPENISEANTELRDKQFPNTNLVDNLMKDIINS